MQDLRCVLVAPNEVWYVRNMLSVVHGASCKVTVLASNYLAFHLNPSRSFASIFHTLSCCVL